MIVVGCLASPAFAHPPDGESHAPARWWTNARTGDRIEGHLLAARSGKAAIESVTGEIATIPIEDLRGDDEAIVLQHVQAVRSANESRVAQALATRASGASTPREPDATKPVQAAIFEAFGPFVRTRFDERWLHVESDGLPHPPLETRMMVGITAWQQQVPLPQPYVGDNAWKIPLRPELAATPISGRTSLMRGAIALAANGIPIFNALNNGGRDSFAIGELDEFGGHCGRADDYHYHAAPLFLEQVLGPGMPIAYALDGFAIYGLFDPKAKPGDPLACPLGSHEPLDDLNGHFCEVSPGEGFGGGTRSYHYHSSKTFPYINGGLRGKVSIEGSGTDTQVVPQPRAVGVRPALPPLRGARIVGFEQTAPTAWSLRYEIGGRASSVDYRLEEDGKVVFEFVGPTGERRIEEHRPRERRAAGAATPREGRQERDERGGRGATEGRSRRGGDATKGAPPSREEPGAQAPIRMTLASPGVGPDGVLDVRHTCDGEGISPRFDWSGVPAGTRSLALVIHHRTVDDVERIYLVRHGIPADADSIAEGDPSIGRFGLNSVGRRPEYAPPCSQGPGEKVYVATLYALSAEPTLATPTPTREQLLAAIKDITLATATLEFRYSRPAAGEATGERSPVEGDVRRGRRGQQGVAGGSRDERSGGLLERMTAFKTEVPATDFDAILASPTATTMTVSVRAASDRVGAIEFGREGETIRETTEKVAMKAGVPTNFTLDGLAADRGYVYRFLWWTEEGHGPGRGEERRFHTPRATGSAFTFVVQADSHLDQGVTPEAYAQTLANMAAARPDFLVDLGDTFMTGKRGQDFERAESQYDAQRHYFGLACDAMPLFMVLGNHDGETGSAGGEIAAWSYRERASRFPPPAIDGVMYTGATAMKNGRGANHYAFEWGDALFVVLDPFWPTAERSRGGGGRSGRDVPVLGFEDSSWSRTLGRSQYDWLARTLAASDAPQKFVFVHHLVGGRGGNEARGGVESATSFEWGGRNADGSEGFASRRPGWPMPIHDLLVEHGVTAVFHGHDHLYVHAMLDGIHYQCVPQPGNLGGNTRSAAEYGYASGTILGSPGHLRISIAGDATATVEFVRTAIEGDAAPGSERRRRGGAAAEANGAVVDSYEIRPRVASRGQDGAEP